MFSLDFHGEDNMRNIVEHLGNPMSNTAHIYKAKSGTWNMSFHHPVCREGSIGKKIHRSLKVSAESDARALQETMNQLLALAHETPSLLPTRSAAVNKYPEVIVNAFYDCMTPEPVDYLGMRERAMPLPPRLRHGDPSCCQSRRHIRRKGNLSIYLASWKYFLP